MGIINYKVRCKKCNELVLYTWRKYLYCKNRHFVRRNEFSDILPDNNCLI